MSAAHSVSTKSFDYNTLNCLTDEFEIYGHFYEEGQLIYNKCIAAFEADWHVLMTIPPTILASRKIVWLTQAEALLLILRETNFKVSKEQRKVANWPGILVAETPTVLWLIKEYRQYKGIQLLFEHLFDKAIAGKQLSNHEFKIIRNSTSASFLSSTFKYMYGSIVKLIPNNLRRIVTHKDLSTMLSFYEKAWSRYDQSLEKCAKKLSSILPYQFNQANIIGLIALYSTSYADNFDVISYFNRFLKTFKIHLDEDLDSIYEREVRKPKLESLFLDSLVDYFMNSYGNGGTYESYLEKNHRLYAKYPRD